MDRTDRARVGIAVVSMVALIALLVVLSQRSAGQANHVLNGDTLGMQQESLDEYQQRAKESLAQEGQRFALVTFDGALTPEQADTALAPVSRVNAVLLGQAAPMVIPEPVDGENRATVIRRYEQFTASQGDPLSGAVVFDDVDALRGVEKQKHVFAVEALPGESAWGHFGVRPVLVDASRGASVPSQ